MRKLTLIVHTSLDGFVAGTKGELDGFDAGEENLQFVAKLTETADAGLFGRLSYQMIDGYWLTAKDLPNATKGTIAYSTWYNSAKKIVVSKTLPKENSNQTIIISDNIPNEILKIKQQPGRDIFIFGSPSVTRILMQADLIDDYWIFINPAIFGQGIPLFTDSSYKTKLKIGEMKLFPNGELAIHYTALKHDGK